MSRKPNTGRDPTTKELLEAERVAALHPTQQSGHASAVPADHCALSHINTYGTLPDFYIDKTFVCRSCDKKEIWRARDQKWYYEVAKGHIDSTAVKCYDCRVKTKESTKAKQGDA